MKYVSIDLEMSGLDSEKHQILSFGAIIEDTENKLPFNLIPKFYGVILHREIVGSPRAIGMNWSLIGNIGDYIEGSENDKKALELVQSLRYDGGYKFYEEDEIVKEFFDFLFLNGYGYDIISKAQAVRFIGGHSLPIFGSSIKPITINVAGKNFATSDKLFLDKLPWWKKLIRTRARVIDPAILFCDWKNDDAIPTLDECKKRQNIPGVVAHTALDDAWDVIQLLRTKY